MVDKVIDVERERPRRKTAMFRNSRYIGEGQLPQPSRPLTKIPNERNTISALMQ